MRVAERKNADDLAVLRIGEPALRRPAPPMRNSDFGLEEMEQLGAKLRNVLLSHGAAGVAAPQIGIPVRAIALNATLMCQIAALGDGDDDVVVHLDPTVEAIGSNDEICDFEACLSVPRIVGVVCRARRVRYNALTLDGRAVSADLRNRAARVVQHEVDHLSGILFLDRCDPRSVITAGAADRLYRGNVEAARTALGFST